MTIQPGAPLVMPCAEHADRLCEHLEGFTECPEVAWLWELWSAYYLWLDAAPMGVRSELQAYTTAWLCDMWGRCA